LCECDDPTPYDHGASGATAAGACCASTNWFHAAADRRQTTVTCARVVSFLATLRAIATEMRVERFVVASQLRGSAPAVEAELGGLFPEATAEVVDHDDLKRLTGSAGVHSYGEYTPYTNVILCAGVACDGITPPMGMRGRRDLPRNKRRPACPGAQLPRLLPVLR
jgi:hypothetical protein